MQAKTGNYRQRFQRLDHRLGVSRFWNWWVQELVAILPSSLRQQASKLDGVSLVEVLASELVVKRIQGEKFVELGRMDCVATDEIGQQQIFRTLLGEKPVAGGAVVLSLSPQQVLLREVELPLAAEENLRQVLAFEIDRLTPFKHTDVYFDFRVLARDSVRNRLRIQIVTVERFLVDSGISMLKQLGVQQPGAILVLDAPGIEQHFDFLGAGQRLHQEKRMSGINVILGSVMLVLVLLVLILPLVLKRQAVRELNPRVEQARMAAESTNKLRAELEQKVAEHNFLLEKRQSLPPVIIVLDELTRLLPDDTWVQQFDVKGNEIQIQGETGSSSKLVVMLEQSKILQDAGFRSPLTKGMVSNSERFHLAAKIQPMALQVASHSLQPASPITSQAKTAPEESSQKTAASAVGAGGDTGNLQVVAGRPANNGAVAEAIKTSKEPSQNASSSQAAPSPLPDVPSKQSENRP